MQVEVKHNAAQHRFEARIGGELALLEYSVSGSTITMYHTETPPAAEGKGVAGQLAAAALAYARAERLTVVPQCSFVAHYIAKHPEYEDLLKARA
jgi:predicted GNAT family acetyltransferase